MRRRLQFPLCLALLLLALVGCRSTTPGTLAVPLVWSEALDDRSQPAETLEAAATETSERSARRRNSVTGAPLD